MHVHDPSLGKITLDVNFLWKEERVRLLISSLGASSTPSYSLGPSNLQAILQDLQHLKAILRTFKKCRVLKLQALAWKDNVTRGNSGNIYASGTTHT
ncbi:hypothetical protein Tco_1049481 [Tanacetum coccineum]